MILCDFCHFGSYFYGKYVSVIGLKAPGNYCDQFWSKKFLVLLCGGSKPNISMISGIFNPWDHSFTDLNIPNYFENTRKLWDYVRKILFL